MKVNILLSTYNGARYVAEQIESIQAQTYTEWNLLIRDDGSTDGTQEIIARFAATDSRIRWINPDEQDNLGVIQSFYQLSRVEPADFYFFSDQDDVWLPEKVHISLAEAEQHPATKPLLVYTDLTVVDEKLEVLVPSMIHKQSGHANTTLLQELTENTATGGVAMANHALISLWQGTETVVMHDWYLALLAAALGELVYIDQPTELYRQHSGNVLGARTLSKYARVLPQALSRYWKLITGSQKQAAHLLALPLEADKRSLVEAYVSLLDQRPLERLRLLRQHGFRKNKWYHTVIFTTLILTKIAYKES